MENNQRSLRVVRFAWSLLALLVIQLSGCGSEQSGAPDRDSTATAAEAQDLNTLQCNAAVPFAAMRTSNFLRQRAQIIQTAFGRELASSANESHDCQRLILYDRPRPRNGPLVTIWVFKELESTLEYNSPVNVGAIFSGEGGYQQLKIQAGRSCLWMGPDTAQGSEWHAWIVPLTESNQTCANQQLLLPDTAHRLNAIRLVSADTGSGPAVSRWIESDSTYKIGLQCGRDRCVISGPRDDKKIDVVRPLYDYDEQRLSKFPLGEEGVTGIRGRIQADPYLKYLTHPDSFKTWRKVATITFFGVAGQATYEDSVYYAGKFRLGKTLPATPVSVELLYNSRGYWIRYDGGRAKKVLFLADQHLPSSVSWRWSEYDEYVWVQCPFGCCTDDEP